jgi:SAM-dependent methyltransferase
VKTPYTNPKAWSSGPDLVYGALSAAVVAEHGAALERRRVLDLGAGTGATSRALALAGAVPVALDASWPMVRHRRESRAPAIVADASALPLGDDAVGATVAAFVLSHVPDPVTLLREAGRVTAPGGIVLAVSFAATGARSAVHGVVEDALRLRGWTPPPWFRRVKEEFEPAVSDPHGVTSMALSAGLHSPAVSTRAVDTGIDAPDALVDWRLGSPGVASFVARLPAPERHAVRSEALHALGPSPQPLCLELLVLSSRAAAARPSASA